MDRLIAFFAGNAAGIVILGFLLGSTEAIVCGALAFVLASFMNDGEATINRIVDEALNE